MKAPIILSLLLFPVVVFAEDLAEAAEWTQSPIPAPAGSAWRRISGAAAFDGVDCITSDTGAGLGTPLTLAVPGPGLFTFRWKQQGDLGSLKFLQQSAAELNAAELGEGQGAAKLVSLVGTNDWQECRVPLAPGRNILTWQHDRGTLPDGVFNAASLDAFTYTSAWEPEAVSVAVGAPENIWKARPKADFHGIRFQQNGTPLNYAVLEGGSAAAGEILRVRLRPGWYSIRWKSQQDVRPGLIGGGFPDTQYELLTSWGLTSGYCQTAQDLIWTSTAGFKCLLVDEFRDGMNSYQDALETEPGRVWTTVPSTPGTLKISSLTSSFDSEDAVQFPNNPSNPAVGLETPLDGPARVTFQNNGGVGLAWGGISLQEGVGITLGTGLDPAAWRQASFLLPPGSGLLRFSGSSYYGGGVLDRVNLTPLSMVSAREAMDSAALSWTLSGGRGSSWYGVQDASGSADGIDCLRAGPLRGSGTATALWNGAGALDTKVFSTTGVEVRLAFDGKTATTISQQGRWQDIRLELPAGQHSAVWNYVPLLEGQNDQRHSCLDAAQWNPGENNYAAAADSGESIWLSAGDKVWTVSNEAGALGSSALSTPRIEPGRTAWIETHFTGPADVRFRWKGQGSSLFTLTTGNISAPVALTGPSDWHERVVSVDNAGPASLRWTMNADGPVATEAGAALLDNVRIIPRGIPVSLSPAALAALDLAGQAMVLQGGQAEVTGPELAHEGGSALKLSAAPAPATGPAILPVLRTTVDGPYDLSFWWRASGAGYILAGSAAGNNQVRLADSGDTAWKRAVICSSAEGPHQIEWSAVWTTRAAQSILLDGLVLSPYGAAGTFSGSLGAPAGAKIRSSHLGTDHSLADPDFNHDGRASVRLGSDTEGVVIDSYPRLATWWQRHDRRDAGKRLGGPADSWYSKTAETLLIPAFITAGTSLPGWHIWLDDCSIYSRPLTIGEQLKSPDLEWSARPPEAWTTSGSQWLALTNPAAVLETNLTGPGFFYSSLLTGNLELDGMTTPVSGSFFAPLTPGPHPVKLSLKPGDSFVRASVPTLFAPLSSAVAGLDLDLVPEVSVISLPASMGGLSSAVLAADGEDAAFTPLLTPVPFEFSFSVTGPGSLRMQISTLIGSPYLTARVDDGINAPAAEVVVVPPGTHRVTYSATGPATGEHRLLLDMVTWRYPDASIAAPDVPGGLDNPGLVWTTRATQPFSALPVAGAAGGTAAASPLLPGGETSWLETSITGPGFFIFKSSVKVIPSSSASDGRFGVSWGGLSPVIMIPNGRDRIVRVPTAGPLTARFSWSNGSSSLLGEGNLEQLLLDDLQYIQDATPGLPMNDVMPVPGVTWGTPTGTATTWRALDLGFRGPALVAFGGNATSQVLPLSLAATGRVAWSFLTTGTADPIGLYQSSTNLLLRNITASQDSITVNAYAVPSQQNLEFRVSSGSVNSLSLISGISLTRTPVSLTEALDTPGLTWNTGGDAPWSGYLRSSVDESAGHGPLTHNQSSWIETTVTAPCWLSWEGTLWSEAGDVMSLSVNGLPVFTKAGNGASQALTDTRRIPGSGPVTLRWKYSKNGSLSSGADGLTLTTALIIPDDTAGVPAAADLSGLTITQGSNVGLPFSAELSPSAARGDSVIRVRPPSALPTPPSPGLSWVETQLTGRGLFSFAAAGNFSWLKNGTAVTGLLPWAYRSGDPVTGLTRYSWEIPETTPQTIRLQANLGNVSSSGASAILDDLRFDPAQPLSFLNAPGMTWATGPLPWTAFGTEDWKALISPNLAFGQNSWVEATLTGPGIFDVSASGSGTFSINGIESGTGINSRRRQIHLPSGKYRLRWNCATTNSNGLDKLLLNNLSWLPGPSPYAAVFGEKPIILMVENPSSLTVQAGEPTLGGGSYLKPTSNLGTRIFEVMLPSAGRVSSLVRNGTDEWQERNFPSQLTAAFQVIDFSVSPASFNQITGLTFRAAPVISDEEAVDSPCIAWVDPASGVWQGVASAAASHDGSDVLTVTSRAGSRSGTIQGPAVFRFWWWGDGTFSVDGQVCASRIGPAWTGTFQEADFLWRQLQVDLAPGAHTLTWSTPATLLLDEFSCSSQPGLLSALPSLATAAVSESGAWRPGTSGGLISDRADVLNRDLVLLMQGPALYSQYYAVSQPPLIPLWNLNVVPNRGLIRQKFDFTRVATTARIDALALEEVAPAAALGLSPVIRSTGWRGFQGGGYQFVMASEASANLEINFQGPGMLRWQPEAERDMPLTINGSPSGIATTVYPLQYLPLISGLKRVKWETTSYPAFLSRVGVTAFNPGNNFALWAQAAGLSPASRRPEADPDADGRTNQQEFIFGGNPGVSDGTTSGPGSILRDGQLYPSVEFTARGDGYSYILEARASDGSQWLPRPAQLEVLSDVFPYRRLRLVASDPLGTATGIFRVKGL